MKKIIKMSTDEAYNILIGKNYDDMWELVERNKEQYGNKYISNPHFRCVGSIRMGFYPYGSTIGMEIKLWTH